MSTHFPAHANRETELSFLVETVREVSNRAKQATDPVVRNMLFAMKSNLLSYAICRYSSDASVTTQYHACHQGPLVYVQFNFGNKKKGAHVPFAHLTGCGQYRTIRCLGNPYVFNRIHLDKADSKKRDR